MLAIRSLRDKASEHRFNLTSIAIAGLIVGTLELAEGIFGLDSLLELPLLGLSVVIGLYYASRELAKWRARQARQRSAALPEQVIAMLRDTSHELRTPITIARGYAHLVRAAAEGTPAIGDIEIVLDELDRLTRLTDRLLVLAVPQMPRLLEREAVDLRSLIVGRTKRWSVAASRDWKINIETEVLVLGDTTRLASALDALVENAVLHTVDDDEIVIGARAVEGIVTIEVCDRGTGIPPDQLALIHQYLSHDSVLAAHGHRGTGLGLPIVKAIAESHGGWVGVSSQLGVGSVFSIHLPSTSADEPAQGTPQPLLERGTSANRRRPGRSRWELKGESDEQVG